MNQQQQPTLNDLKAHFADMQAEQANTFNLLCRTITERDAAVTKLAAEVESLKSGKKKAN